jgi:hypothetical protein
MKRVMGFKALYWLGFDPSRTPPCGVALSAVATGDRDEVTAVTVCMTIEVAISAIICKTYWYS